MTATPTQPEAVTTGAAGRLIDGFMPLADVTKRHETLVRAPADIVFDVAQSFDLHSIPVVHAIFWLRSKLLRATPVQERRPQGLVAETVGLGWGILRERPGRELVMGAVTQPWKADVKFTAIPPDGFQAFAEPDLVKMSGRSRRSRLGPRSPGFARRRGCSRPTTRRGGSSGATGASSASGSC